MASRTDIVSLSRQSPRYPSRLIRHLGDHAPQSVDGIGNPEILGPASLAFFCSVKCPGDLILKTYDLADTVFIAHAAEGGKTERFCERVLAWGKTVMTLESTANANLIALGAEPIRTDTINARFKTWASHVTRPRS